MKKDNMADLLEEAISLAIDKVKVDLTIHIMEEYSQKLADMQSETKAMKDKLSADEILRREG